MVVEVEKIRFLEESGYFGLWVIYRLIRVHADNDFFLLASPLIDLRN